MKETNCLILILNNYKINHFTINYEFSHLIQKIDILNWPCIPKPNAKTIHKGQMLKELLKNPCCIINAVQYPRFYYNFRTVSQTLNTTADFRVLKWQTNARFFNAVKRYISCS